MKNNSKKQNGFTLLEVVIAVGILVVIGGVAVAASTRAINTQTYSKNRTKAQDIARNQIERLQVIRNSDYSDNNSDTIWNWGTDACLRATGNNGPNGKAIGFIGSTSQNDDDQGRVGFNLSSCGQGGTTKDSPPYHIEILVEKVPDDFNGTTGFTEGYSSGLDENKNLRRITVTVIWEEPFLKGEQKVELKSYISNDKLGS